MNIAETIKDSIERECSNCFSLYAGYGMNNGEYVRWPTGVQLSEKRNDKGRVIKAAYRYADDSVLHYSYNANIERYTLTAKEGAK